MAVVQPDFNATTTWTGGGYDPSAAAGGYDPTTGFSGTSNTIGGQAAVSENYTGAPSFAGGYAGEPTAWSGGGYDPSAARFETSGLAPGGGLPGGAAPTVGFSSPGGSEAAGGTTVATTDDWRVRISLADSSQLFYKNSGPSSSQNQLMQPLSETNGVIFPYTPSITMSHTAIYNSQSLTHSNYAMQFYQGSEVSDIQISGDFTVQDTKEGKYLLAAIYFFRACSKMFFGFDKQTGLGAGNPPPIVYLDGYGEHYFPHVPCVLTSFSHQLPDDKDYIEVPIDTVTLNESTNPRGAAGTYAYSSTTKMTRLPTVSSVSITLRPVYSRKSLHEKFNLEDFAAGRLLRGSGSFL